MTCDHTESWWNPYLDQDYDGNWVGGWDTRGTFEDIDLHRYKCKKCGEVGYYSGRAQAHYEEGKPFWDD